MKPSLVRMAVATLCGAALSCLAADHSSDNHVSKTESGLARALSGFFNSLNEQLEQQDRERQQGSSAYRDDRDDVTVDIQGDHGWVPIHLERRGSGYVGPRGEYYSRLPDRSELERTYGRTPSSYTGQKSKMATTGYSNEPRSDVTVEKGNGEVTVYQPNRSPLRIRTEGSLVKEWRVNSDGSVSVLSHSPGGESVVQNFSLRDGRQRDRVLARDIRDGRPPWAVGFESGHVASSGAASSPWAGTSVRRAPGEVTVEPPGRTPLRIRTEGSIVKEWRVDEQDGAISVLSLVPGNDPVVQNFSLRDGRQRDRILARDIRNGRPAWAADFAGAGSGGQRISQPLVTLRVTDPVRDGKTKGPRVTVAGTSSERSVRLSIWDDRNNRVAERDVPTRNEYWNTQVPLERGRYRLRAEGQSGRDHKEFWFEVR